ncbi:MAG: helix-turn-helix transcriptional regulator [Candidatus Latescibacteria bacterium]|nr:helix-turn-helix transcriptional regulator [Candidatus Latescibacterota bacterium]
MERDKDKTKKKIIEALAQLLAKSGFSNIGINAIAREAGVDKVLIYRYFGGLSGLFAAFAEEENLFPKPDMIKKTGEVKLSSDLAEISKNFIRHYCNMLRKRPVTREILRWELIERNELTDSLAETREKQGLQVIALFDNYTEIDFPVVASVITAGITYLSLRAKTANVYSGIDITSDKGWERIEQGLVSLIDKMFPKNHLQKEADS